MEPPRSGHVVVCGLSDVGLRVVEQLILAGEQVVVVDDEADTRRTRLLRTWGVDYVAGDARRPEALEAGRIASAAAIVCTADSGDLANLEIALTVREYNADARLVVQLSNPAVSRAIAGVAGKRGVLDAARLAVPSFVEACLQLREHEVVLGTVPFVVTELVSEARGALREVFGALSPVAVVDADGAVTVCPGRDMVVAVGDRVTVVGTREQVAGRRTRAAPTVAHEPRRTGTIQLARSFVAGTERPIRRTLLALAGVAVVSMVLLLIGYHRPDGRHMGVLDSVYFTTETLTTVGFGDFYFGNQPDWLRVWAIILMIIGATLVTVLYALLTNYLVSRRISETLGRRQITNMRDHVIVVGLGTVGLRVIEGLRAAGRGVVVIERDRDNRFLAQAEVLDVPVIIGDATQAQTLAEANLTRASAVAVLTSSDLANIETGLVVEDLLAERRPDVPVVLRVFDRQLATTIEKNFGFQNVRSTSALAAPWFVGAALGLDVISTFYVENQPFLIGRLTIAPAGGLDGRAMLEVGAQVRVLAIRRRQDGRLDDTPRRDDRFAPGDIAYVTGPYDELLRLLRRQRTR